MKFKFAILGFFLICLLLLDLIFGSVQIPISTIGSLLFSDNQDSIYSEIIFHYRFPKAITAILVGAALSVSGVLMQTFFRNPLAGPDILGVSSGASLGVALLTLSASALSFGLVSSWSLVGAAILGAVLVLFLVVMVSIKIPQTVSLLIIGLMFGNFAGAIVTVLQSTSNPDTLKLFITWTFGSLSSVSGSSLYVMGSLILVGLVFAFMLQKQLNAFLLGENYAAGLGVSVFQTRLFVILITALLAGTSTAFTGPIAFIGVTMPHLARFIFKTSNHQILIPASLLCGSCVMLICDLISQLPGFQGTLPINSVTALFGAPIIVWIILEKRR